MYYSKRPGWSVEGEDNSGESSIQANPNKTKQNCLDFLGFIRPNWDLSVGYVKKNKKICSRLHSHHGLCAKVAFAPAHRPTPTRSRGLQTYTTRFRFKEAFAQISNSPHRPAFFMCRKWGVPPSRRLTLLYGGFFAEPEMAELRATLRDIAKNPDLANAFDRSGPPVRRASTKRAARPSGSHPPAQS